MFRRLKAKLLYLRNKIIREKASPEYIARGWAIGMFWGCFMAFGFQLICSLPTAFLLRGSKIGAVLGTLLTNQITIFFIYPAQCWVGNKIMGGDLSYAAIKSALKQVLHEQSFTALKEVGMELFVAFFIGGTLLALIMTPLTYWGVLHFIQRHRLRVSQKQQRRKTRVESV